MENSTPPIVSVIVPMYNVGKYIEQCIESVLAQTFRHFEVLCVDDECTDDTLHKLARFRDPRIRVISQKNRGLSGARNTGIIHSRGIYLAFLDADDFWASDKLAKHVVHLNSRPAVGVSYCPSILVDDEGQPMGIQQTPQLTDIVTQTIMCRNPIGNGSAPVIRKQLLMKMNLNSAGADRLMIFDESLRQSEDIELWLRIALNTSWKFEGIKYPLTYYRINSNGLSANVGKQFASWSTAMEKNRVGHEGFFKQHYGKAKAYQQRYLARRAIQSQDAVSALWLIHKALLTHLCILRDEPLRTLTTWLCAYLALLPGFLFRPLKRLGMELFGKWQRGAEANKRTFTKEA